MQSLLGVCQWKDIQTSDIRRTRWPRDLSILKGPYDGSLRKSQPQSLDQWLMLALPKGPNREGVTFLREDGNRSSFRNVVFIKKHWTMNRVHTRDSFKRLVDAQTVHVACNSLREEKRPNKLHQTFTWRLFFYRLLYTWALTNPICVPCVDSTRQVIRRHRVPCRSIAVCRSVCPTWYVVPPRLWTLDELI
jgi:hypothetical protein